MSAQHFDVIVIGQGIAGLTAAKQARQQGVSVACIEEQMFGGLVININELDGAIEGSGTDLASNLMLEASEAGVEMLSECVTGIDTAGGRLIVSTDQGSHNAAAVVIASGAKLRKLGVPGEAEFEYRGVASCADCDGPMYQEADVVVVAACLATPKKPSNAWMLTAMAPSPKMSTSRALKKCARPSVVAVARADLAA